jgi:hypothetical protein
MYFFHYCNETIVHLHMQTRLGLFDMLCDDRYIHIPNQQQNRIPVDKYAILC